MEEEVFDSNGLPLGEKRQLISLKTKFIFTTAGNSGFFFVSKGRYITNSTESNVLRGKLALVRMGMDFAMRQQEYGVEVFSKVLGTSEVSAHTMDYVEDAEDESPYSSDEELSNSETEA